MDRHRRPGLVAGERGDCPQHGLVLPGPVCLVGWERLDRSTTVAASAHRFEAARTTDRTAVLHVLAATADLAAAPAPEVAERLRRWCDRFPSAAGRRFDADALANRIVAYLVAVRVWLPQDLPRGHASLTEGPT